MINRAVLDFLQLLQPRTRVYMNVRVQKRLEYKPHIRHKRDRRTEILADLGRIDIDVNDVDLLFQILRLRNRSVGDSGPDHDQKITVRNRAVRVRLAVVAQHAEVQRMRLRKNSHTHHGMHKRNLILLTESPHQLLPVSEDYSAADTDQRFFRLIDGCHHLRELLRVHLHVRLVPPEIYLLGIHKFLL